MMKERHKQKSELKEHRITQDKLKDFIAFLHTEERSEETIKKYLYSVRAFRSWLGSESITKDKVSEWKETLKQSGKAAVTINGMLAAIHCFFSMLGWNEYRVKYLKVQRQMFRDAYRELNRDEFHRLVMSAEKSGNKRLSLLLEAICATGIRVSEVKHITVDAARRKRTDISLKGKIRTILIPDKLSRKLLKYCDEEKITFGEIFITSKGNGLSRRQIWVEMKRLCTTAGVDPRKVYPHNLRHLFARSYYMMYRDIVQLADILGHSSIETTRIYLISTGIEHAGRMERMRLIS